MYSREAEAGTAATGGGPSARRFALKAATDDAHTHVEDIIRSAGMFDTLDGYRRFLAASWALRKQHEDQIDRSGGAALWKDWPGRRIAHLIAQDIADLGIAARIEIRPLHPVLSAAELLGTLYVLEGSSLGARVLSKSVGNLGLSGDYGARHLHAQAGDIAPWRSFLALLDSSPVAPCHATARAVFGRFAQAYQQAMH